MFKKLLSLVLTFVILLSTNCAIISTSALSQDKTSVSATKAKNMPVRTNTFFSGTKDTESFANDRVIVRVAGDTVQPFSSDGFFGVEIESVEELMTLEPQDNMKARALSYPDKLKVLTIKEKGRNGVMAAVEKLNKMPGIVYAEPDYIVHNFAVTPNDTNFDTPSMWGMKKIHAPEAWEINTGSSEVVVAVIDSGIDFTHPDLAANMWRNPGEIENDGIDNDGNGFVDDIHGWGYVWGEESFNRVLDSNGHGTHIAGIIGAAGNNHLGTTGVNWNVKLMAIKAMNNGGEGYITDLIKAIEYARMMGAPIINNSYGSFDYSQAQKDAISATDALFVVAAGNSAMNNDNTPCYPASYGLPNIISVAATARDDALTDTSNYGKTSVHIAAPGKDIFSTTPVGTYSVLSGTSMAAPFVAGTAALLLADNPDMNAQELKSRLIESVDPVPALANKVSSGGRLNVYRALNPSAPAMTPYVPELPPEPLPFEGFAGGDGSYANPYQVSTPAQLNAVREYSGKQFIQINDIDMTYDTQNPNGAYYDETSGWKPIDDFSGIYDGGGYKITGLKISRGYETTLALFAVNSGWIINLGLENGSVTGPQAASIAGYNEGFIVNSYNTGSVTGFSGYVGGLAIFNYGEIINCYNTGAVSEVGDYVAIVGGIASIYGITINCYNSGIISAPCAPDNRLGGIISYGFGSQGNLIKNCYNAGISANLNGSGNGAVAYSTFDDMKIENSYCLGEYGGSEGIILTDEQMKQESSFKGWNFEDIWNISSGVNNGYPHLRPFAPMPVSHDFAGGDGSPGNPYKVSTPEQLNSVRNHLNKCFIQINDIDMTYTTQSPNGLYYNQGQGWLPIGTEANGFKGLYNGGGYTISGLKINRPSFSCVGLFATVEQGTVMNSSVTDAKITGGTDTGAIAGLCQGSIEQCYSEGTILASHKDVVFAGGIAGRIMNGAITNCFSTGDISGNSSKDSHYVGGIAGGVWGVGTITNCYNIGKLSGNSFYEGYIGGIVGWTDDKVVSSYFLDLQGNKSDRFGKRLSAEQLKNQQSYIGWDFETVWTIRSDLNGGYPILTVPTFSTILGDANGDGIVNINDVTEIQKYLAELTTIPSKLLPNANVKGHGDISIQDATLIQKFLADMSIGDLPIGIPRE